MKLEKLAESLLLIGGITLVIVGYFSHSNGLKILGLLPVVFMVYVAADIIINH